MTLLSDKIAGAGCGNGDRGMPNWQLSSSRFIRVDPRPFFPASRRISDPACREPTGLSEAPMCYDPDGGDTFPSGRSQFAARPEYDS